MDKKYIHTIEVHNTKAAHEILPFLFGILKHESVVDVGCGLGTWLKVALENGANEILGIDGEYIDTDLLCIDKCYIKYADISEPIHLEHKYDLVISLEVAEHLPEERADSFIESLQRMGDTILFSAAIPGQGGQNHLNEQWHQYWIEKFVKHSYNLYDIFRSSFWNNENIEWWYSQNMLLFSRNKLEGFEPEIDFNSYVHPELFKTQIKRNQSLEKQNDLIQSHLDQIHHGRRGITEPLQNFYRAILKKLGKS